MRYKTVYRKIFSKEPDKQGWYKKFLLVMISTWMVFILSIFIPVFQVHANGKTVHVGVYQNKPKVFMNDQGQADGFFIDLLKEIAKEEGWVLSYTSCDWETCLQDLQSGEIDLMPDVAYSPEREMFFDFHRVPAAESWSRVYTSPELKINRMDQLNNQVVAVLAGSIQESVFKQTIEEYGIKVQIVTTRSANEAFQLVADKSANAAVINHFFGDYFYQEYGLNKSPIIFNATSLFFATAEGENQDLLDTIDMHLGTWRDNPKSVYYVIQEKWLTRSNGGYTWLRYIAWIAGGVAIIFGLVIFWNLLLRKQVNQRTIHLEIANRKLLEKEEGYQLISSITSD